MKDYSEVHKYEKYLKEYEELQSNLEKRLSVLPSDVITEKDAEVAIKRENRIEEETEKKLGSRF